jgi:hypothetical protein
MAAAHLLGRLLHETDLKAAIVAEKAGIAA